MNSYLLSKITNFLQKLERNSLFMYFAKDPKFKEANKNGTFFSNFKQKLQINAFLSLSEFQNEIIDFLHNAHNTENISRVEKRSIHYLKKKISEKLDSFAKPDLVKWKSEWCDTYQQFAELMNENKNAKMPMMRLSDDSLPVSEEEMISLKNKIENKLEDSDKEILINLISTLETGSVSKTNECAFDLHDLKNETLFAVISYVKTIKDKNDVIFGGEIS